MNLAFLLAICYFDGIDGLHVLQIVPGFTNSHVLFNYRLASTLTNLGHKVKLWTQMEMNMVATGVTKPPENIPELQIPIHFSDKMKAEGLTVFQKMMFSASKVYDLWWTGQQFKDMRTEACEQMLDVDKRALSELLNGSSAQLAIGHFHDLCPVGLAKNVNIDKIIWITHGTSLFDFAAVQMGVRTFPSYVPHPLSSFGDNMSFLERAINLLWYISTLDFVNLPINLLYEENQMYRGRIEGAEPDLWDLSARVPVTLINGEQYLDFPRPLPLSIAFTGEIGKSEGKKGSLNEEMRRLVESSDRGFIIFSLGTVCNTSSMPANMRNSFLRAFASFPRYTILWRFEDDFPEVKTYKHIHLSRWLPQKELMRHPKMRLLIAHGGYNSFLETAKAGVPVLLMPLFADQFINARRAKRFGIAGVIDKTDLSAHKIEEAMKTVLDNPQYHARAKKLSSMLEDKPSSDPMAILSHRLRLATAKRDLFSLKTRYNLNFFQHHLLDIFVFLPIVVLALSK